MPVQFRKREVVFLIESLQVFMLVLLSLYEEAARVSENPQSKNPKKQGEVTVYDTFVIQVQGKNLYLGKYKDEGKWTGFSRMYQDASGKWYTLQILQSLRLTGDYYVLKVFDHEGRELAIANTFGCYGEP